MQADKELWIRISQGDQQAYAELYRSLFRSLYNYGRKFSDEEALIEDAIQETLLSIWTKREILPSIVYPSTYFFSAFRYSLIAKLKAGQRFTRDLTTEGEPEFAADHFIMLKETDQLTQEKIHTAIAGLTSRQREAIFLRFYEGMPYEEVAKMLDITVKATYKIIARALEELRKVLNVSGCFLLCLITGLR